MSIVIISGDHPRHHYLASKLASTGLVKGWVKERREAFIPNPPPSLKRDLSELFVKHFSKREESEWKFFAGVSVEQIPTLEVDNSELNSRKTRDFIRSLDPKLCMSYGCKFLKSSFLKEIKSEFWNIHGGLSKLSRSGDNVLA